jgi:hypothetical protein
MPRPKIAHPSHLKVFSEKRKMYRMMKTAQDTTPMLRMEKVRILMLFDY